MIRAFKENDWPQVCRVYDEAKPFELATGNVAHTFLPLMEDQERVHEFRNSNALVYDLSGSVLGFVTHLQSGINFLFVRPSESGKGIGSALLRHALSEISGDVHVWAMEGNEAAIRLYKKQGFKVVQRINGQNRGAPTRAVKLILRRTETDRASS
jgi:ribosomal protein S18 acetylase RimI-like enzyme